MTVMTQRMEALNNTEGRREDPAGRACLSVFYEYGHIDDYALAGRMTLGRTGGRSRADIAVPVPCVSGLHGEFGCAEGHWFYRDRGSTNGSRINGDALLSVHELMDGDILTVVPRDEGQDDPAFMAVFLRLSDGERICWRRIPAAAGMTPIRIGSPAAGHAPEEGQAVFVCGADGISVSDRGYPYGVFVNGERCAERKLRTLDAVRLGRNFYVAADGFLWEGEIRASDVRTAGPQQAAPAAESKAGVKEALPAPSGKAGSRLVIDIDERSVRKNFKKRILLKDIHLVIDPGDMVLILGGSGAGKSTFIKSVMGYDRAQGTIRYGDKDVYADYETMKREIGYVPQQDLVRPSDTVGDTLLAAARIRMPGNTTLREQTERVDWLMDILGLADEKDNLISAISGGQKKRVSIGIELAADPALFFLDEPDSGLDGVMARGLMEKLRVIADMGKIVLVITHTPDRAADLFTKVLVLGKTEDNIGHLLYCGRPEDALAFFGTDSLEHIVHRINRKSEGGEGLADYFYNRFASGSGGNPNGF